MFDGPLLEEVARKAAGTDVSLLADGELKAMARALARSDAVLASARGHALAELDARGLTERESGLRTASWWARTAGLPGAAARSQVRTARALRTTFAGVDEALADGRISSEHARAIVGVSNPRIIDQVASVQAHLVESAEGTVFDAWKRNLVGFANLLDQDGGHDPNRDPATNSLRFHEQFDGTIRLEAVLAGAFGVQVKQAVEARADVLFARYQADHEICADVAVPGRPQLLAEALIELVREGLGADPATGKRPTVEVTLVATATDPTDLATEDGAPVDDEVGRAFACDADWYPVVVDALGVPLRAGRAIRHATRAQRRAAGVRDGGCVFPGCDAPASWSDMHHVRWWDRDEGPTDIENLASLCRRHHGITHRQGWSMHATADGWFWWQTPSGTTFWSQRHGTQRAGPTPPDW